MLPLAAEILHPSTLVSTMWESLMLDPQWRSLHGDAQAEYFPSLLVLILLVTRVNANRHRGGGVVIFSAVLLHIVAMLIPNYRDLMKKPGFYR